MVYRLVGVCVAGLTLISHGCVVSVSHDVCLIVVCVSRAIFEGGGMIRIAVAAGEFSVGPAVTTFAGSDAIGVLIG